MASTDLVFYTTGSLSPWSEPLDIKNMLMSKNHHHISLNHLGPVFLVRHRWNIPFGFQSVFPEQLFRPCSYAALPPGVALRSTEHWAAHRHRLCHGVMHILNLECLVEPTHCCMLFWTIVVVCSLPLRLRHSTSGYWSELQHGHLDPLLRLLFEMYNISLYHPYREWFIYFADSFLLLVIHVRYQ